MDNISLISKLLHTGEGNTLDYKREQYPFVKASDEQKSELLKDMLAFTNAWRSETAYILIGYDDGQRELIGIDPDNDLDDAQIQQFINGKTNRIIEFSYRQIEYEGKMLGLYTIPVQKRPIYLKKDFGKLKADQVVYRRGSSSAIATPDEVAEMGDARVQEKTLPQLDISMQDLADNSIIDKFSFDYIDYKVVGRWPEPELNDPMQACESWQELQLRNPHYHRQLAHFVKDRETIKGIYFCLQNKGSVVLNDIRVVVTLPLNKGLKLLNTLHYPEAPSRKLVGPLAAPNSKRVYKNLTLEISGAWGITEEESQVQAVFVLKKLQAGEKNKSAPLFIQCPAVELEKFEVDVFADELPLPIKKVVPVQITVKNEDLDSDKLHGMKAAGKL